METSQCCSAPMLDGVQCSNCGSDGIADIGHSNLVDDLSLLLLLARQYQFHDFKNTDYAAPKMELYDQLQVLSTRVKNGKYDNEPI